MDQLASYVKTGIRLNEDIVALESLSLALAKAPTKITSGANNLLNIATEHFCVRWNIPRVLIANESFQSTAAVQSSIVACEGVKEMAVNAWHKFIEWLKGLIARFKAKFEKNKVQGSLLKARAKKLSADIEAITDFHTVKVEGDWPTLVCDGKVDIGATQHFIKAVEIDSKVFAKELTEYINKSLNGDHVVFKPALQAAKTTRNVKAYGVSKATVYAVPNNTYMAIGNLGDKPQLDFFPGESTPSAKTKITITNPTSIRATVQYINDAIEFLENQTAEYKAFIDLIEQLTKSAELPFKTKFDNDDARFYYYTAIRMAITCGSDYIQHIDRLVVSSTHGLLSYAEEVLKTHNV